jgi:autotransporter-associated beta strand protein
MVCPQKWCRRLFVTVDVAWPLHPWAVRACEQSAGLVIDYGKRRRCSVWFDSDAWKDDELASRRALRLRDRSLPPVAPKERSPMALEFFKKQLQRYRSKKSKRNPTPRRRATFRPLLEGLEDRLVPATLYWDPIHAIQTDPAHVLTGGGGAGTWDTTTTNKVWFNTLTNIDVAWTNSTNDAVFGGTAGAVTVGGGGVSVKSITFNIGDTLTGGTVTLTSGASNDNGGTIDAETGSTSIADVIASGGTFGLTKIGPATLTLSGTNSYTNRTVLTAGTLSITNDNQLGASTNNLIFNGGTLNFSGPSAAMTRTIQAIGASAGTLNATNTLTLNGPVTGITSLTVSTSAPAILTLAGPGTIVLGGGDDNANLGIKVTAGTVTLAKNSSSTVHAVAAVPGLSGGTLQLGGMGNDQIADGTGTFLTLAPFTMSGGTFDLMGLNETIPILAGTGGTITSSNAAGILSLGANNQDSNFAGLIQDNSPQNTVNLTKVGTGTLMLTNVAANTYTGGTVISAGTISIGNDNLISTGPLTLNGGTLTYTGPKVSDNREVRVVAGQADTLNLAGTATAITGATQASPIVITTASTAGMANNDVVAITGVGGNTAANGVWTIAGLTATTFQLVGSTGNAAYTPATGTFTPNTLTLTGRVHGVTSVRNLTQAAATLTKSGPSALSLTGTVDNDNLGVNVTAGGLFLAKTSQTVNSAVQTLTLSGTPANGSAFTLAFKGATANVTYSTIAATLQGNIQVALDNLAGVGVNSAGMSNTNVVAASATSVTITFQNDLANMALPDLVPGGGLTIGVATTTPGGAAHAVAAITGVASGAAVKLGGTGGDQVADNSALFDSAKAVTFAMSAGAIFDLGGLNETLPTLSGNGLVTNNGAAAALTIGTNNLDAAFAGVIQDGSPTNTLSLTKVGTGAITLSGNNTYSNRTVLTAGTLSIGSLVNNLGAAASTIYFNTGGTLSYTGASDTTMRTIKAISATSDRSDPAGTIQITKMLTTLNLNTAVTGVSGLTDNTGFPAILAKTGDGTLTLSGNADNSNLGFSVTGGTLALAKTSAPNVHAVAAITDIGPNGTVQLGGANNDQIANGTSQFLARSPFAMSGGTFDMNGLSETIPALSGTGTIINKAAGAATLTVGQHDTTLSSVFGGTIVGTGTGMLSLVKDGKGTLELTGTNTYPTSAGNTGTTTITQGTLAIGGGGTTGSISPNNGIVFGAAGTSLIFNRSDNIAYTGAITGPGGVVKAGGGTLTLSGANNYSGGTTIRAGILSIGSLSDAGTSPLGPSTGGANNAINIIGGTLQLLTDTLSTTTARNITLGKGTIDVSPVTNGVVPGLTLTGVISNSSLNGDTTGVGSNVNISNLPNLNLYETTIATNPANPLNLIAAAGGGATVNGRDDVAWYSLDGGLTWSLNLIPNPVNTFSDDNPTDTDSQAGDPEIVFDKNGVAYFLHLTKDATAVKRGLNISGAVSTDGGVTWTPTAITTTFADDDKEQITVGPDFSDPTNPAKQIIYVTFHRSNVIQMVSSKDGFNWTAPVQVSPLPDEINSQVAVGSNGHLFVTWEDTGEPGKGKIKFASSMDGGVTFSSAVQPFSTTINTFKDFPGLGPYKLPAQPQRGILANPSIVVDNLATSAHKGRIYIAFTNTEGRGGHDNTGIFVIFSDDEGQTWSNPVKVNDDATINSQFNPWMAIDPTTGNLAVSWMDARDDPLNHATVDYIAFSTDGGMTFSKNVPASRLANGVLGQTDLSANIDGAPNPTGRSGNNYGDYEGLTFNSGIAFPIWPDGTRVDTLHTQLLTAPVLLDVGKLIKTGAGTLTLSGANTYSGGTTISGGSISIGADNGLGSTKATAAQNAVQTITLGGGANGGGFTLTFGSGTQAPVTTGNIAWNADRNMLAANIQTQLNALALVGAGNAVVNAVDASNYTVTFQGSLGAQSVQTMRATSSLMPIGTTVTVATTTFGSAAAATANAIETITFAGTPNGGSFKLTFKTGTQSNTTADIPWNSNKDTLNGNIQSALSALSLVGNNAVVKTVDANHFTVTFQGSLAGLNLPTMTTTSTLTGTGAAVSVATTTVGGKRVYLTLDGGTLQTTATFTLGASRNIALTAKGGAFSVAALTTLTVPAIISDAPSSAGALTMAGTATGSLVLTGANNFTGGTTIAAGTLVIGDGDIHGVLPGNVTTNGALQFNRSDNFVYGGVIRGTGNVTQQGVGILILTNDGGATANSAPNASDWSGGTTVAANGGELLVEGRIKNDATARIVNGSQLVIKLPDKVDFTFNGVISGAGFLVKKGNNKLTLGGVNDYTGFTEINQGTLSISQDLNLGRVPATFATNVLIAGGTLQATATFPLSNKRRLLVTSGTKTQNASIEVLSDNAMPPNPFVFTVPGRIDGSAPLFKIGTGTLVLSATTSSYSGGTTINAGILQVNNDANLGNAPKTAAVNLTLNGGTLEATGSFILAATRNIRVTNLGGTLMVDPGFTLTAGGVASADSANAKLTKSGTGILLLKGDSSAFAGETNLSAGTLQIGDGGGNGGFGGDIANSGTLIFNSSKDLTYGGTLDGTGTLTKSGTGKLTLTADSGPESTVKSFFNAVLGGAGKNGLTGNTMVTGGMLIVTGSISASAVSVAMNATLGGSGKVGALTLAAGAHLLTNITSATASDNLNVSGTVMLDGGGGSVLDVNIANGLNIPTNTAFTILTSTGAISGKFAAGPGDIITIGTAKFKITYNSKTIVLTKQP